MSRRGESLIRLPGKEARSGEDLEVVPDMEETVVSVLALEGHSRTGVEA
ncbi:hypothetical protein [Jutongia sp.]